MIFGLKPRYAPPANWTPLEGVVVLKCLDGNGEPTLWLTSTESLTGWERIGMLTAALDVSRHETCDGFVGEEDEGDS